MSRCWKDRHISHKPFRHELRRMSTQWGPAFLRSLPFTFEQEILCPDMFTTTQKEFRSNEAEIIRSSVSESSHSDVRAKALDEQASAGKLYVCPCWVRLKVTVRHLAVRETMLLICGSAETGNRFFFVIAQSLYCVPL